MCVRDRFKHLLLHFLKHYVKVHSQVLLKCFQAQSQACWVLYYKLQQHNFLINKNIQEFYN